MGTEALFSLKNFEFQKILWLPDGMWFAENFVMNILPGMA